MNKVPMTVAGEQRLRDELDQLKSVERPKVIAAIAEAREHGDLKENSEYKMAKQDQQVLMAQKTLLERDLGQREQVFEQVVVTQGLERLQRATAVEQLECFVEQACGWN